jgi:hypothetical protein
MQLSLRESNSNSDAQEISPRNPKFHYHIHKSQQLEPILSQTAPVHTSIHCFHKICFNIILLRVSHVVCVFQIIKDLEL